MLSYPAEFRGYRVQEHRIAVVGRPFSFIGPCELESLLESPGVEARFTQDEYMPYWAEFWPASLLLMDAVAAWGPPAVGAQVPVVLELGCGLGAVSVVLASMGYRAIASDYDEDALAFAQENARMNGLTSVETRLIDWRRRYDDLSAERIVAAEVLYEQRNLEPIAEFIRNHLVANGFALICDRNRSTADSFPEVAGAAGLRVEVFAGERVGLPGEQVIRGRFFRLRLRGL